MIGKFNLYDVFAVLLPGLFALWIIPVAGIADMSSFMPTDLGDLTTTSMFLAIGYVVGLLIQAIGQLLTERMLTLAWGGFPSARVLLPSEHDDTVTDEYKADVRHAVKDMWGSDIPQSVRKEDLKSALKRNQEIFRRMYWSVEKLSNMPEVFNAQYGMFRSLLTMFGAITTVLAVGHVVDAFAKDWPTRSDWIVLVAITVATVICYLRVAKRASDFTRTVLDVFLAHNRDIATKER